MKALVTGGGGFLGGAIVRALVARGDRVRSFSRAYYSTLTDLGVEQVRGDLGDSAAVTAAARNCDIIFHVAAKPGVWGPYDDYYRANVVGTENVLTACRAHAIQRLVYTSSPSVVFNGSDMEGVDETVPYPEHFEAPYPQTKAIAEQQVLGANGPSLATVALRPHLIWGPEDNHLVPRIVQRGRAGQLRRIGERPCRVDHIYIDNAAEAHLQAADRLAPGSAVAGKAYFISNDEPIPLWEMVNRILAAAGAGPVERSMSPQLAYAAGFLLEKIYTVLKLSGEPRMTRFLARELSTAHWFDIGAARRDFGYQPRISTEEGFRRLRDWLRSQPLP